MVFETYESIFSFEKVYVNQVISAQTASVGYFVHIALHDFCRRPDTKQQQCIQRRENRESFPGGPLFVAPRSLRCRDDALIYRARHFSRYTAVCCSALLMKIQKTRNEILQRCSCSVAKFISIFFLPSVGTHFLLLRSIILRQACRSNTPSRALDKKKKKKKSKSKSFFFIHKQGSFPRNVLSSYHQPCSRRKTFFDYGYIGNQSPKESSV